MFAVNVKKSDRMEDKNKKKEDEEEGQPLVFLLDSRTKQINVFCVKVFRN